MANSSLKRQLIDVRRWRAWLDRPLSGPKCALGWCIATAVFLGVVAELGGPARVDAPESVYSTWAIEHGQLACAFTSVTPPREPHTAPVYPLLSGAIAAIARIGHAVPYPPEPLREHACVEPYIAVARWADATGAIIPSLRIGYVGWLVLMAGLIAWLRTSGRGRTGWEPVTIVLVACLPPVWQCVEDYFHPQDLVAMGLSLCAIACGKRGWWALSGVLIAFAVLSQQFALLVAVPLFVLAPRERRLRRFTAAAVGIGILVIAPLFAANPGASTVRSLVLGSGSGPLTGDTVLVGLDLSGAPLVLLSRVLPIVLSFALSYWVLHRIGRDAALETAALLSLVAVSLGLRLVFEQNLFVYYLMALTVMLVLLDVQRGHIRASLVAWLTGVTMVFSLGWRYSAFAYVPWGGRAVQVVPAGMFVLAVILFEVGVLRHATRWNLMLCALVIVCVVLDWRSLSDPAVIHLTWIWQVIFVGSGVALAAGPLLEYLRSDHPHSHGQLASWLGSPDLSAGRSNRKRQTDT